MGDKSGIKGRNIKVNSAVTRSSNCRKEAKYSDGSGNVYTSDSGNFHDVGDQDNLTSLKYGPRGSSYKVQGLTLECLDRLSPSIVTLQSLNSDWPPNTADSGYEPSPICGDIRFTYPGENEESGAYSSHGGSPCESKLYPHDTAEIVSIGKGKSTQSDSENQSDDDCSVCVTPKYSRSGIELTKSPLSATPPINIPNCKMTVTGLPYFCNKTKVDFVNNLKLNNELAEMKLKPIEKCENQKGELSVKLNTHVRHSKLDKLQASKSPMGEKSPPEGFRRPRTYSCPESSRPTPPRPPVPLYPPSCTRSPISMDSKSSDINLLFTSGLDRKENIESRGQCSTSTAITQSSVVETTNVKLKTPSEVTELVDSRFPPFGQIVHSRNWSTPVVTSSTMITVSAAAGASDNKLVFPDEPLRRERSRDAIVDLTDDGPGHRRRVLVLALPDVVIDTSPQLVNRQQQSTASNNGGHHSRQSSIDDIIAPLPAAAAAALGRTGTRGRPRALSCDVTMEETVGRALRTMADQLEGEGLVQNRRNSQTLFDRVRLSFRRTVSRILNVNGNDSEQDYTEEARTSQNSAGRADFSSNICSSSSIKSSSKYEAGHSECCSPTYTQDDIAFYDLEFMAENDDYGEPRYSLTRRGGDRDDEYFL